MSLTSESRSYLTWNTAGKREAEFSLCWNLKLESQPYMFSLLCCGVQTRTQLWPQLELLLLRQKSVCLLSFLGLTLQWRIAGHPGP